jgi:hypothetical protein
MTAAIVIGSAATPHTILQDHFTSFCPFLLLLLHITIKTFIQFWSCRSCTFIRRTVFIICLAALDSKEGSSRAMMSHTSRHGHHLGKYIMAGENENVP